MPKTLEESLRADPPCYPCACAIQSCLRKSNNNESSCARLIDSLYECCAELYKREGPDAKSTCCPKESVLMLKIKQRQDAGGFGGDAEVHETRRR
ncbi:hypothetical protein DFP73DRAFT_327980 [Morchella snyderi]|nr:hypothetical protein DFP73DRAFT_327980 [Morchella snyderi]